jgi:hypothetical protein
MSRPVPRLTPLVVVLAAAACASAATRPGSSPGIAISAAPEATLAQIYYWRAKPGKFDEYSAYVRDSAAPIDAEAHRRGAFLSVTTYTTRDTTSPWTHMRVFLLRDSAQLAALGGALDSAGLRLQPDSLKRHARSAYSATLRDLAGQAVVGILH